MKHSNKGGGCFGQADLCSGDCYYSVGSSFCLLWSVGCKGPFLKCPPRGLIGIYTFPFLTWCTHFQMIWLHFLVVRGGWMLRFTDWFHCSFQERSVCLRFLFVLVCFVFLAWNNLKWRKRSSFLVCLCCLSLTVCYSDHQGQACPKRQGKFKKVLAELETLQQIIHCPPASGSGLNLLLR